MKEHNTSATTDLMQAITAMKDACKRLRIRPPISVMFYPADHHLIGDAVLELAATGNRWAERHVTRDASGELKIDGVWILKP